MTTQLEQYVIDKARTLRVERGLLQIDIAYALGVTKGFVAAIESPNMRAKYNLEHLNKLAILFDCEFADFFPSEPFTEENMGQYNAC